MSHAWQDDFPVSEALTIGGVIRNHGALGTALVRDAWVVAEYGLGQLLPEHGDQARSPAAPILSGPTTHHEEAMDQLVAHTQAHQHSDASQRMALPPLPWRSIVAAILQAVLTTL